MIEMIECTNECILKKNKKKKRRNKRLKRLFIIFLIIVLFFFYQKYVVSKSIYNTCYDYLSATSLKSINKGVEYSLLDKTKYEDLITIEKNNQGDIVLITANNYKINYLSRKITEFSKLEIDKTLKKGVPIPWLAFFGIGYLSGHGKNFNLKTVNVISVNCEFESCFNSSGINQTLHSIYVNVTCDIKIEIPLNNKNVVNSSKILICESVLVGNVPDFYLGKNLL